jgi:hypothetical protein
MQYLHSFLSLHLANVGSKTLISLNDVPKSTFAAAAAKPQWYRPLSNFAFVTAAFAIFAVVTLTSAICCRYVSISDLCCYVASAGTTVGISCDISG